MPKSETAPSIDPSASGVTRLRELEAKRAALRGGEYAAAKESQQIADLEAVLALEIKHGPERVRVVQFAGWARGTVTLFAVRAPVEEEIAIYRQHLKATRRASKTGEADITGATVQIGQQCLAYPPRTSPEYDAMIAAYPGCDVQIGTAALELSAGVIEAEGKA